MTRVAKRAGLLAVLLTVASAHQQAQTPQPGVRFEDFSPTTFSIVVRDADATSRAWADVLGIPAPKVNEPAVVYPPDFEGDRAASPRMASMQMANMTLSMHQPPLGRNYWRAMLDAQGVALYRMNFRVRDLADQTAYFERKGGKLVIGDPAKVPYVNVNLWPAYGVALELNGVAPGAPATPPAPPPIPATAFAANPVFKIAFVVPDLDRAVREYADLFGLDAASATRVNRPIVFPEGYAGDRHATVKTATLRFRNGVLLEVNEPQGGQSVWRTHLEKHGRSIFSVGFRVKSVREQVAYLQGKGGTLVLGGADAPYAYFDFTSRLGTVIEVHQ